MKLQCVMNVEKAKASVRAIESTDIELSPVPHTIECCTAGGSAVNYVFEVIYERPADVSAFAFRNAIRKSLNTQLVKIAPDLEGQDFTIYD